MSSSFIKWVPLSSSNINKVFYNPKERLLYVVFKAKPGTVYTYSGVSSFIYRSLISAESSGEYFSRSIKNYNFTRQPLLKL